VYDEGFITFLQPATVIHLLLFSVG